ncbi:hypothetical protein OUZ56_022697 [Daphnia magna]|uniref:Uncharacterized protein n=1 Tax=Daphnia magna TaxID=35525 RepID=A0ABR0AX74_9CRUS|nr:hypothetical protein OUZ56_022697 [Daphnia magna]
MEETGRNQIILSLFRWKRENRDINRERTGQLTGGKADESRRSVNTAPRQQINLLSRVTFFIIFLWWLRKSSRFTKFCRSEHKEQTFPPVPIFSGTRPAISLVDYAPFNQFMRWNVPRCLRSPSTSHMIESIFKKRSTAIVVVTYSICPGRFNCIWR